MGNNLAVGWIRLQLMGCLLSTVERWLSASPVPGNCVPFFGYFLFLLWRVLLFFCVCVFSFLTSGCSPSFGDGLSQTVLLILLYLAFLCTYFTTAHLSTKCIMSLFLICIFFISIFVTFFFLMSNLKVVSLNVKGINHVIKRQNILAFLKKEKCQVAFLQETHLTDLEHIKLRRSWVGQVFYSSYNSKSRGVAILLHRSLPFTLDKTMTDKEGRYVLVSGYLYGELDIFGCMEMHNFCQTWPHFLPHIYFLEVTLIV